MMKDHSIYFHFYNYKFLDEDKKFLIPPEYIRIYEINKITAYDFDGVLSVMPKRPKPYRLQNGLERKIYLENKIKWLQITPCLWKPKKPFYIISGRKEQFKNISIDWLERNKLNYIDVFFMNKSSTSKNMIEFKTEKLKELKIERYFEDDLKILRKLKKNLPYIEFVPVPRNEENQITLSDIHERLI